MDSFRTGASEFPNDNPALHEGAVWVCFDVAGRGPRAVVRAPSAAPPAAARTPVPAVSAIAKSVAPPRPVTVTPRPLVKVRAHVPAPDVEMAPEVEPEVAGEICSARSSAASERFPGCPLEAGPETAPEPLSVLKTDDADRPRPIRDCAAPAPAPAPVTAPEPASERSPAAGRRALAALLDELLEEVDGDAESGTERDRSTDLSWLADADQSVELADDVTVELADDVTAELADDVTAELADDVTADVTEESPTLLSAEVEHREPTSYRPRPAEPFPPASERSATVLDDAAGAGGVLPFLASAPPAPPAPPAPSAPVYARGESIDLGSALLGAAADDDDDDDCDFDGFDAWVEALVDAALEQGATRAAAAVGELLSNRSVDAATLSDDAAVALEKSGIARLQRGRIRPLPEFREAVAGWQSVLRGEPAGSGWGAESLDEFSAGLLAALAGDGAQRDSFKRMLRQRGVAAFGMLEAA